MGVTDLARAVDFYAGRFAGQEIFRRPDNQIVILGMPGPREDWLEFIVRQEQGGQDHICLAVPDVQQAYRTLVERGATIRGQPRVASNGYRVINMTDSNGLRIELMEPQPAKK
jgi:methylmalonyl-CoA/ethylmalonyl-CoA epimerase